jgi:Ca-activated chloride channel family protein
VSDALDWLLATFARPWLLVLVPLVAALVPRTLLRLHVRRRQRLARLGDLSVLERLLPPRGRERLDRQRALLLGVAATCLAIALAGPRWGERPDVRRERGIELALVLDVSASMLAEDDPPSRLERMRRDVRDLLAALPGSRAALVVVAGKGYVLTPLTGDHDALALFLDELSPDMVSQGGTALGDGIRRALQVLGDGGARGDRALVVFSDGESWDDDGATTAAAEAKAAGVVLVTVGYGTTRGSTIPLRDGRGTQAKRDGDGNVVITRADPERLAELARAGDGTFVPATIANHVPAVRGALGALRRSERVRRAAAEPIQRFTWFLWPAFACLVLDALLPFTQRRRREVTTSDAAGTTRGPGSSLAAAALVGVVLVHSLPAQQSPPPGRGAPPASGSNVGGEGDAYRYFKLRRWNAAVAAYRRALTIDRSPRAYYNLGTALVAADSLPAAADALERAVQGSTDPDLRFRALYNLGLAQLERGRRARGSEGDALLDASIATYKRALRGRGGDADAAWNLELALREKNGGGGGGGGQREQQPPPAPGDEELEKRRAESVLDNAARDERDVLARRQRQRGRPQAGGGRDW